MDDNRMSRAEFQALVRVIEETPRKIEQLLAGLGEGERRWKPAADEFSATESICHLRDIEEEGYCVRIRRLLEETEPVLSDLDGARLARERDYNNQNMLDALDRFTRARFVNVAAVKGLSSDRLSRRGTFEGVGSVTIGQLLSMMREHDQGHIEELEDLRARLEGV